MSIDREKRLEIVVEAINKAFDVETQHYVKRHMTHEELQRLQEVCSLAFDADLHPQVIQKIMNYCVYVDRHMRGRAAGHIEDLIIRYLMRYFASLACGDGGEGCRHLEIGVLFGASTIFSCHAVRLAGKKIPTVVIDPFEGYYGQAVDTITKEKVDEETFWSNIDRFGMDRGMVEVLKGLSTDGKVIERAKRLRLISLLIDGDHTYEGVKNDWLNYSPLVAAGGLVMFDDYNSPNWPGVTDFVNNEVLSNLSGKWTVVLIYGTSIILKRTGAEAGNGLSPEELGFHDLMGKIQLMRVEHKRIISEKEKTIAGKEKTIEGMRGSLSWKITMPLRWLRKKFEGH